MADCGPALALMGLCFLFMWFVGGLSGFHCYLVGSNQTTYENFRCESGGGVGGPGRGGGRPGLQVWEGTLQWVP